MVRRWVCCFQSDDRNVSDKPCSGQPSTATNEKNDARLDEFIKHNWQITVNEMSTKLGVSMDAVEKLISSLGYSKRYPRWVLQMFTLKQKNTG